MSLGGIKMTVPYVILWTQTLTLLLSMRVIICHNHCNCIAKMIDGYADKKLSVEVKWMHDASSRLECASDCFRDEKCVSFQFSKTASQCAGYVVNSENTPKSVGGVGYVMYDTCRSPQTFGSSCTTNKDCSFTAYTACRDNFCKCQENKLQSGSICADMSGSPVTLTDTNSPHQSPPLTIEPPQNDPPPPAMEPPQNDPPPPAMEPPQNDPPPPAIEPPQNDPPPPAMEPPQNDPPPPAIEPPQNDPPPPAIEPSQNDPPPPAKRWSLHKTILLHQLWSLHKTILLHQLWSLHKTILLLHQLLSLNKTILLHQLLSLHKTILLHLLLSLHKTILPTSS
ncbi:acrosin-like [Haliotis rubra]|uniref:acrosin-like n=1 Tax=Haliotis rubra TaxID=36100 RepID=UPI001EE5278D|nr:acrosin-like [Haliotis rubra]